MIARTEGSSAKVGSPLAYRWAEVDIMKRTIHELLCLSGLLASILVYVAMNIH